MSQFSRTLRAIRTYVALASLATWGVGCQAIFGDFKIDDSAFGGASGTAANDKGGASGSDSTNSGGTGGDTEVQIGPVLVMPTKGLFTTEWGSQATFTVVLLKQPKSPVTIGLSSSLPTEGRVSPTTLVFNDQDWNAPQLVTVTGVDDGDADLNKPYKVITAAAESDDPTFAKADVIDVSLINVDNETAGVTVAPVAGLMTSEAGLQDTFTVVLNSVPDKDVIIDLTTSLPTEATVSPTSLTFTAVNWMAPQLVTVTGVDDKDKDRARPFEIITQVNAASDPSYKGVEVADVSAINLDNETAGLTIMLVSGVDPNDQTKLRTSESGDTATFSVALSAPPSDNVTVPIVSSAVDEAQVSPAQLLFTPLNWNAPQTVTVMGADDKVADGDQPFTITLGAPTGDDSDYSQVAPLVIAAANVDNDKPGFSVMLVSGIDPLDSSKLVTTEAGTSATFTIALNSMPVAPVTIYLSSSLKSEGTVSPSSISFSTLNWASPQTVSVRGVDDKIQDGNPVFFVRTSVAVSEDPGYVLDPPDVQVKNEDNDSAGVKVTLANGIDPENPTRLVTGENGDTATFSIALTSQPTADVSIALVSNAVKEGTISPTSLKFTATNYAAAQTITITGVDDKVADGNQPYVIAIGATSSTDPNFNLKFGSQVLVTNRDNDTAGVIVTPITGLVTSEAGAIATFTVQLQSQPTADVTIGLSSNNTAEGRPNVSSVKFTATNWNAPQTVTVTGQQDDDTADGDVAYKIITDPPLSTDLGYGGPTKKDPPDVSVTNLDDDSPGVIVTPIAGLTTTEAGGTATFTISLQSRPTQNVKINLSSNRPLEGSVSPASLTFTNLNYKSAQIVTVTGVDDASQDGNQAYLIVPAAASSTDPKYNLLKGKDVSVTNIDNDTAGFLLNPVPTQTPAITTEKGGTSKFTVQLTSLPSAGVTVALTSTNIKEGTVSPASLSFTTGNWNAPQTVTVTGVDDKVADNGQPYKVHLDNAVSTDPNYSGHFAIDVPFSNSDDDIPGFVVNAAPMLQTKEDGTTPATFTVSLLSQPTVGVTIALSSSNTNEGKVAPASLSFTTGTWNIPQTVTITGQQDEVADGNQAYSIFLANAVSMDPGYSGKFATQVNLKNVDDDQAGFSLFGTMNLQTTEKDAGTATFTVALASKPVGTATVTLGVSSSNTKEGTVSPTSLTFTTGTWNVPQTVTVTGVNDSKADGLQVYSIVFTGSASLDPDYAFKAPGPVSIGNADDDQVGVNVTPTTCTTTPTTTATFAIVLNSQPVGTVTIPLSSDNTMQGTVTPASVVFDGDTWNVAQTVTVKGVDPMTPGTMTSYNIVTGIPTAPSDLTTYNGYTVTDVACVNNTP